MSQILVVDDDEAFLETMKDGLGEQGYEVVTCGDPRSAYEILNKPFNIEILLKVLARASGREEETLELTIPGFNLRAAHETLIRKLTIKALGKTGFNVTRAARLLGVTRQCLIRYINRYHLR